jgi:hypothetical protein
LAFFDLTPEVLDFCGMEFNILGQLGFWKRSQTKHDLAFDGEAE